MRDAISPARRRPDELQIARRTFLAHTGFGLGAFALSDLLARDGVLQRASASESPQPGIERWTGVVRPLHHPPRIRRVIFLCMAGGASHLETFDYKPKLAEMHGKPMPESLTKGQPIAQLQGRKLVCFAPQHPFRKWGESGQEISVVLPHIGSKIADDICIVRSMTTQAINHDPAHTFMNTGTTISGRPCMGSWIWYGIGSEADNLPGFVVLVSEGGGQSQPIASRQWHSGFLPSRFQGVQFRSFGDPVLYLNRPPGVSAEQQKTVVRAVQQLNAARAAELADPEIATRISQYEMAFRMQTSVPELMEIHKEPKHVLQAYGVDRLDGSYAANCLLARRLAERGVRFIQLYHRGWDHHGNIKRGVEVTAKLVDQATAALVSDLKQRGMLDETLVIWAGEFGRTPMAQGTGRDHHIKGFSVWFAGGGVKGGTSYGATDELGYNAVENVTDVHDMHATMLHLLGIDHKRLTYRFQGRDFRLTDVAGRVLHDILV